MTFTVKANTNRDEMKRYAVQQGMGNSRTRWREEYFEKLSSLYAGKEVIVNIQGDQAYAELEGDTTNIVIPQSIPDQIATSYTDDVWAMLFQKIEMYHELGHVLYTDWPSLRSIKREVQNRYSGIFHEWWNILEDASIERLLSRRFDIENDLLIKNENLLKGNQPRRVCGIIQAISMRLMEYKHDLGFIDKLLDDSNEEFVFFAGDDGVHEEKYEVVEPIIEHSVPDILEQGDPVQRNQLIHNLYKRLKEEIDFENIDVDLEESDMSNAVSDDGENNGDHSGGETVDMPSFDESDENEPESDETNAQGSSAGGDDDEDSEDEEMSQSGAEASEEDGDDEEEGSGLSDEEKEEIESEYREDMKNEQGGQEENDDEVDSLEEWGEAIERGNQAGIGNRLTLQFDAAPMFTQEVERSYKNAKQQSNQLSRYLKQKLRQERKQSKKRNLRSGTVNSRRIHRTAQGDSRVFHRTARGEDKEYACVILLDRSGSMEDSNFNSLIDQGESMIGDAEEAAGALSIALEEVGVSVSQLSLHNNDIVVEKDFTEEVEQKKEDMFHGQAVGGTPLSPALTMARERLEETWEQPFMIVIGDGFPAEPEKYKEELSKCTMPVLGVFLTNEDNDEEIKQEVIDEKLYHRLEVRNFEEVFDASKNLVQNIMF